MFRTCLVGQLLNFGSGSSGGALPNFLYEEPFSVKNRGGGAILKESQIMALPKRLQLLRRVLPNTPLLATHILFGMLNFSFAVAHM
jgi:hypothetical protein